METPFLFVLWWFLDMTPIGLISSSISYFIKLSLWWNSRESPLIMWSSSPRLARAKLVWEDGWLGFCWSSSYRKLYELLMFLELASDFFEEEAAMYVDLELYLLLCWTFWSLSWWPAGKLSVGDITCLLGWGVYYGCWISLGQFERESVWSRLPVAEVPISGRWMLLLCYLTSNYYTWLAPSSWTSTSYPSSGYIG